MNLEDYLKDNISNQKDIENTTSFYDKFNNLSELYNKEHRDDIKLLRSEGKYNSKICFIFKDKEHLKECSESLKRIMNVYDIQFWDVLILFENKFNDKKQNINILFSELLIVNPLVVYIFDNVNLVNELLDSSTNQNKIIGFKMINVNNISNMIENNLSSDIFDLFEYLITYNY